MKTSDQLNQTGAATVRKADGAVLVCNFADNYYGDQVCQWVALPQRA